MNNKQWKQLLHENTLKEDKSYDDKYKKLSKALSDLRYNLSTISDIVNNSDTTFSEQLGDLMPIKSPSKSTLYNAAINFDDHSIEQLTEYYRQFETNIDKHVKYKI